MAELNLTTSPSGLLALSTNPTQSTLDAYFYTFTKAQANARNANRDPSSQQYFKAMVESLSALGWTILFEATSSNSSSGSTPTTPLASCAYAFVNFLKNNTSTALVDTVNLDIWLKSIYTVLQNLSPEQQDQLDIWWNGIEISGETRYMTVCQVIEILGQPLVPLVYYALINSGDSWRSLIAPSTNFHFVASPILLRLNWSAYNQLKTTLKSELEAELINHINTTTLEFENASS
jgi:hypothetical protein